MWCWRRHLRVPWTARRSNQSNLKEDQPWIFPGRTVADAEAEAPVFWSSDVNRWLIGKVPDAGKDWGQKEKKVSENEMAGWHHQCNGHELGQTSGDGEGQRALACCSSWCYKESDTTGQLNNKQEMARVNTDILGISELKRMGTEKFNSDDHCIYYCGQESLRRNGVAIMVKRVWDAVLGCSLKNRMIAVHFQGKSLSITTVQVYAPTTNAE